ncbi:MAG: class I SAM-dependent methyltransferase [Bacteroidota bacterium]
MKQKNQVSKCYNKTSFEYGESFFDELTKKSLDRLLLRRFAEENMDKGRILDLACGPGQTTHYLARHGLDQLIGIDLSSGMIKEAQRRNQYQSRATFEQGDLMDLRFEQGEIGGAICFYGIVHFTLEELEQALIEIRRILEVGGQLLFSFHVGTERRSMEEFLGVQVEEITFYFFETEAVIHLLKKVGFGLLEVVERHPYPEAEYPSKRAYILAQKENVKKDV